MTFTGWSSAAVEFFSGLEADNSKAYWQAHKDTYTASVLQPMEELLAELAPKFGGAKIFRPYRDMRFSADKSPYKTTIAATLHGGGYVQFSADGLAAGSGMYHLSPDQLERYRLAVAEDLTGEKLTGIVAEAAKRGISVHGTGVLKTAPRGYPKDHPRLELLRYKGLIAWQEWPAADWLDSPGGKTSAKTSVADFLRASEPLQAWLGKHVGPPQTPAGRRR
jgi:uncharacterized protein (TIGR02453 family)